MSISATEPSRRFFRSLAGLLLAASLTPATWAGEPSAAELYGALPLARDVQISPDGNSLALIAGLQGREQLVVWHLDGSPPSRLSTGETEPHWFAWKGNGHLVAGVYYIDFKIHSEGAMATRGLIFDVEGGKNRLMDVAAAMPRDTRYPQYQDQLLSVLPNDADHVLMAVGPSVRPLQPDIVKVDIRTGQSESALENKMGVRRWLADASGEVRAGLFRDKGKMRLRLLRATKDGWENTPDIGEADELEPLAFSDAEPRLLYLRKRTKDGGSRLFVFDCDALKGKPLIDGEDEADVEPVMAGRRLAGYRVGSGPVTYLDPAWQAHAESLRRLLPGKTVELIDASDDAKRFVARTAGLGQPDSFWLLDLRGAKPVLNPLFQNYEAIPPERLAPVAQLTYKASDGLEIPAFLTLPAGHKTGPLPFIVLPHGGPWSHDTGEFDFLAQFLAGLGYGVLQPQYRGSTGYGRKFEEAGVGQWGRKIEDDVFDGTRWLIEQGYADANRIAIVGASFGGYAALIGIEREPALYRCAVSISGVADLADYVDNLRHVYGGWRYYDLMKDDSTTLNAISPVKNVRAVQVPILLMHGRRDFTVPIEHAEAMERALHHMDKSVQTLYLDQADHYFTRESDRIGMLKTLQSFLQANLGAS